MTSDSDKKIIKAIQNRQDTPPDHIWEHISVELDSSSSSKKYLYWAAILLFLVLGGSTAYYSTLHNDVQNQHLTNSGSQPKTAPVIIDVENQTETDQTISSPKGSITKTPTTFNRWITSKDDAEQNTKLGATKSEQKSTKTRARQSVSSHSNQEESLQLQSEAPTFQEQETAHSIIAVSYEKESTQTHNIDALPIFHGGATIDAMELEEVGLEDLSLFIPIQEEVDTPTPSSESLPFYVRAYAGPITFTSLNGNSHLLQEVGAYNTTNLTQVLVGAKASYAFNDAWMVHLGLENVSLSQESSDVNLMVTTNPNANSRSINYFNNIVIDTENISQINALINNKEMTGTVTQNIQFASVPVEISYRALKWDKFSMHTSAGVSTLILTENSINFKNQSIDSEIGKANNLRDVIFAPQASLQMNYQINSTFNVILEPQAKYLTNTFSDTTVAQPLVFGINGGLVIKL